MIEVDRLSMRYGKFKALDEVSFKVGQNEILGLLGPNGAGKTTAMRLLTTYLYPASGTARIDGLDLVRQAKEIRKRIGYLPETAPLYFEMQTDEYLSFVGQARGLGGKNLKARLEWLREVCDLKKIWKHRLFELSKGYKQRVGLAQALVHDPKVLILDEPTSGLDPLQILGIRRLVKELALTKTIIFSTHILSEVEAMADRIVIINEGQVIAQGTQTELEAEVRHRGSVKASLSLEDIFISYLTPKTKVREKVHG